MKIIVGTHKLALDKTPVNEREINVTKCEFEFADEITNDYVKEAYFTLNGNSYKQIIENDQCDIPSEVLVEKGQIELGVVAYLVENETEIKKYNPSPTYFDSWKGSIKDAENTEPITPTDKEQIMQALNNMNIDGNKVGKITTITISYKDGTTKTLTLEDGMGLEYNWLGTSLGIKREDETNYQYVNLQGPPGAPGSIRMVIVNQLPETGEEGTLYFVPKQDTSTSDLYDEYIWINNTWELLGTKQITVDLSDYYTKQETYSQQQVNALIPDLTDYIKNTDYASTNIGGVILVDGGYGTQIVNGKLISNTKTYAQYGNAPDNMFISKGTLENVITGKDLTTKGYVDGLVGNISSVLDTINGEVI